MGELEQIAIVNGSVYAPNSVVVPGTVLIEGGAIRKVGHGDAVAVPPGARVIDAVGGLVVPGFIDLHVHGLLGHDAMGPDLAHVIQALPAYGVTGFLATTLTLPEDDTLHALPAMAEVLARPPRGARCLGIHLEGPFLAPGRPGMATAEWFQPLTWERVRRFHRAAEDRIRMVTFAPELPGAMESIPRLIEAGIVPSVGHSEATFDQVSCAVKLGMTHATHTFNAMRPLHHRAPGAVGAVMYFDQIVAQVIADGVHVHPAVVTLLLRTKGLERVALVSDSGPVAGLPDGEYEWGGKTVSVCEGTSRLADGTLAGAHALLDSGVRTLVHEMGLPLRDALIPAAAVPAEVLGVPAGHLAAGLRADVVILDEALQPVRSFVGGSEVFTRSDA